MDNIFIKDIFDKNTYNINNETNKTNAIQEINTKSILGIKKQIYTVDRQIKLSDDFLISKIIKNKDIELEKINYLHDLKYNECKIKINSAIDLFITDIFFNVETSYFGYKTYNSMDCLHFIQNKLRSKKFNTFIVSSVQIFISWKDVAF